MDPIQPPAAPVAPTPTPTTPVVTPAPVPAKQGIFNGRVGRLGYLLGVLYIAAAYVILILAFVIVSSVLHQSSTAVSNTLTATSLASTILNVIIFILAMILLITAIPIGIGMQIRRWHDLGHSGWLILLGLIPFANFVVFVFMFFIPGTAGPNPYGEAYTGSLAPLKVYGIK